MELRDERRYKQLETSLREEWELLDSAGLPCGSPFRGRGVRWYHPNYPEDEEAATWTPCKHIVPDLNGWGGWVLPSPCADAERRWESTLPKEIDQAELLWNRAILESVTSAQFLKFLRQTKGSFNECARLLGLSRPGVLKSWVRRQGIHKEIKAIRIAAAIEELRDDLKEQEHTPNIPNETGNALQCYMCGNFSEEQDVSFCGGCAKAVCASQRELVEEEDRATLMCYPCWARTLSEDSKEMHTNHKGLPIPWRDCSDRDWLTLEVAAVVTGEADQTNVCDRCSHEVSGRNLFNHLGLLLCSSCVLGRAARLIQQEGLKKPKRVVDDVLHGRPW